MYKLTFFDPKFYEKHKVEFNYKWISNLGVLYCKYKGMENVKLEEIKY